MIYLERSMVFLAGKNTQVMATPEKSEAEMLAEERNAWIREATNNFLRATAAFEAGKSEYLVRGYAGSCRYEAPAFFPVSFCLDRENVDLLKGLAKEHGVFIDWRYTSHNTTYDLGTMYHYEAYIVPSNPSLIGSVMSRLRKMFFG